ncbi:hypothetical protein K504DRAFT_347527, partial [Pleomassaria siparia CBS 279.74]
TSLNSQQQQQQQLAPQQQTQQSQAAMQRQSSYEYGASPGAPGSTAAETTSYLNQYALLAEAAKRAQVACVMRDIEGMEL